MRWRLAGGHGSLQDVVFLAEVHDGPEESLRVLDEHDEHTERDGAEESGSAGDEGVRGEERGVVEDGQAAAPEDQGDGGGAEEFDDRVVPGVREDRVGPGLLVFGVDG